MTEARAIAEAAAEGVKRSPREKGTQKLADAIEQKPTRTCPECGGDKLSVHAFIKHGARILGNDGASPAFCLGCDECSHTLKTFDENEIDLTGAYLGYLYEAGHEDGMKLGESQRAELLEACRFKDVDRLKFGKNDHDSGRVTVTMTIGELRRIRAAIAKAEGRVKP